MEDLLVLLPSDLGEEAVVDERGMARVDGSRDECGMTTMNSHALMHKILMWWEHNSMHGPLKRAGKGTPTGPPR
jgi:hypothetical protein